LRKISRDGVRDFLANLTGKIRWNVASSTSGFGHMTAPAPSSFSTFSCVTPMVSRLNRPDPNRHDNQRINEHINSSMPVWTSRMGVTWATPPNRPANKLQLRRRNEVLNVGHFAAMVMGCCPETPRRLGVQARPETPHSSRRFL
jgi:hypothetical protein